MATMYAVIDETEREWKPPPKVLKGVHYVTMHLDSLEFSDEEVAQYAQALGMMLLSAVRGTKDDGNPTETTTPLIRLPGT